jgi:CheY-like chemotaxis protein
MDSESTGRAKKKRDTGEIALKQSLHGTRVLVVDDSEPARHALAALLEAHGAIVETSPSAHEGLTALPAFTPHVLLSDLQMPEMDGFEFIRRVRLLRDDEGGRVPAAAVTASNTVEMREAALKAGYHGVIGKRMEPEHLTRLVRALREGRTASDE